MKTTRYAMYVCESAKIMARREFCKGEKIATLKGVTVPISLEQGKILGDCSVDTSCILNFILQEVSTVSL